MVDLAFLVLVVEAVLKMRIKRNKMKQNKPLMSCCSYPNVFLEFLIHLGFPQKVHPSFAK